MPGCADSTCRGCLPRPAADGLRLCQGHTDRIATDATQAADLYDELTQALIPTGSGGEPSRSAGNGPPVPRDKVVAIRTEIRHTLASWCRLIAEERGWTLPADQVQAMAQYVARDPAWLAATEYAEEVSDELSTLRRRAWSIAYPGGTRVVDVGPCPHAQVEPLPPGFIGPPRQLHCPGTLRAIVRPADQLLPSEVMCDTDDTHRWDSTQWRQLDRLVARRAT